MKAKAYRMMTEWQETTVRYKNERLSVRRYLSLDV